MFSQFEWFRRLMGGRWHLVRHRDNDRCAFSHAWQRGTPCIEPGDHVIRTQEWVEKDWAGNVVDDKCFDTTISFWKNRNGGGRPI